MKTLPRNCYSCTHTKVCHMRIELAKQVNRFKYLAATPEEVRRTGAEVPVSTLDTAVAQACTEFHPQQEEAVVAKSFDLEGAYWADKDDPLGQVHGKEKNKKLIYTAFVLTQRILQIPNIRHPLWRISKVAWDEVIQDTDKMIADFKQEYKIEEKGPIEGRCHFCHNYTEVNTAGYCPICFLLERVT